MKNNKVLALVLTFMLVCAGIVLAGFAPAAENVPGAPGNLMATPGDGEVTLTWTTPDNGGSTIIGYEYSVSENNTEDWKPTGPDVAATSFCVTGLTNGTSYILKVRAVNGEGEGASASTTAVPAALPDIIEGINGNRELTSLPQPIPATMSAGDTIIYKMPASCFLWFHGQTDDSYNYLASLNAMIDNGTILVVSTIDPTYFTVSYVYELNSVAIKLTATSASGVAAVGTLKLVDNTPTATNGNEIRIVQSQVELNSAPKPNPSPNPYVGLPATGDSHFALIAVFAVAMLFSGVLFIQVRRMKKQH